MGRYPDSAYVELAFDERLNFLDNYNAVDRPTGYRWDRIGYFTSPSDPGVAAVLLGMGDCLWDSFGLPLPILLMLIGEPTPRPMPMMATRYVPT